MDGLLVWEPSSTKSPRGAGRGMGHSQSAPSGTRNTRKRALATLVTAPEDDRATLLGPAPVLPISQLSPHVSASGPASLWTGTQPNVVGPLACNTLLSAHSMIWATPLCDHDTRKFPPRVPARRRLASAGMQFWQNRGSKVPPVSSPAPDSQEGSQDAGVKASSWATVGKRVQDSPRPPPLDCWFYPPPQRRFGPSACTRGPREPDRESEEHRKVCFPVRRRPAVRQTWAIKAADIIRGSGEGSLPGRAAESC
jgi:hypothetical protein